MDTNVNQRERPALPGDRVPNEIAYRQVRHNLTALLAEHPGSDRRPVPACPEWTIRDLIAHLVGISAFAVGRMSGSIRPERSSQGIEVPGLLDEWDRLGQRAERLIAERGGERGNIMVMDAFTHELDIRSALGAPVPDEHPAFRRAFQVLLTGFSSSVIAHNLPALTISVEGAEWVAGIGEPVATLTANRHDLYRSLAGRRTHEQITRLNWSRDSHRWLPAFTWGPFIPPAEPAEPLISEPSTAP